MNHNSKQADYFALSMMLKLKIPPNNFIKIMKRITKKESLEKEFYYFSSHPLTSQRIKMAKQYQLCFKNNKQQCKN